MNDAVLVLNAGSSSIKFAIYQVTDAAPTLVARGQVQGLGGEETEPARFSAKDRRGEALVDQMVDGDDDDPYHAGFAHITHWAKEQFGGELAPAAVGHRVVHGGSEFVAPMLLDEKVIEALERLIPLAPLHQSHNLEMIRAVQRLRPELPQVACFDTAFHRGRAAVTERFGLPDDLHRAGVRRWGFHGLSYASVVDQLARIDPDVASARLVIAHLGSGASLCAVRDGRSVDTTMSFSTLDGLPMGTRCGGLDPGALLFLLRSHSADELEALLYRGSGLLGISGISNDVRALLASSDPRAAEAIDYFVYRTVREVGSLATAMGGLDALVFTAGIGENSPVLRQRICDGLAWLGIALEPSANERGRRGVSPAGRSPSVWVIPSDEERVIAEGTVAVVNAAKRASRRDAPSSRADGAEHGSSERRSSRSAASGAPPSGRSGM